MRRRSMAGAGGFSSSGYRAGGFSGGYSGYRAGGGYSGYRAGGGYAAAGARGVVHGPYGGSIGGAAPHPQPAS